MNVTLSSYLHLKQRSLNQGLPPLSLQSPRLN